MSQALLGIFGDIMKSVVKIEIVDGVVSVTIPLEGLSVAEFSRLLERAKEVAADAKDAIIHRMNYDKSSLPARDVEGFSAEDSLEDSL